MFWAGIMGRELEGPFRVLDGVKMRVEFQTDHFLPWYKKKNGAFCCFRSKSSSCMTNAPSHAAKNTSGSLAAMGRKRRESHGVAPIFP